MLIALAAVAALSGALTDMIDPDAVVTTAPRGQQSVALDAVAPVASEVPAASGQAITAHGLTTAEQIDRWVGQRTTDAKPFSDDARFDPWGQRDDRKMHGEVSAAVGTGDFNAWSAAVSIPIGESARLDVMYSQSKNGRFGYGYPGYGYGYGYGAGFRGVYDPFYLGSPGGYSSRSFGVRYDSNADDGRSRKD